MSGYKLADGTYSSEYKIGDKFETVDGEIFQKGSIVTYTTDDHSDCPWFTNKHGREYSCLWYRLKSYKEPVKQFTKSDLRDGMICTSRCGDVYTVQGDRIIDIKRCYVLLEDISEDLTGRFADLDIMKVEQPTVLFTRVEVPVKSPAQIELDKLHEQIAALQGQVGDLQEQADKLQSCL